MFSNISNRASSHGLCFSNRILRGKVRPQFFGSLSRRRVHQAIIHRSRKNCNGRLFQFDASAEAEVPLALNTQYSKCKVKVGKDELVLTVVEAKSKTGDSGWTVTPDDQKRKVDEKYKRAP